MIAINGSFIPQYPGAQAQYLARLVNLLAEYYELLLISPIPTSLFNNLPNVKLEVINNYHAGKRVEWELSLADVEDKIISKYNPKLIISPNNNPVPFKKIPQVTILHDIIPIQPFIISEVIRNPRYLALASLKAKKEFSQKLPLIRNHTQKIWTVSNYSKSLITKYLKIEEDKIDVLPNWIPKGFTNINIDCKKKLEALGIEGNYLLYVGSASKRKNLKGLLKVYSRLSQDIKNKHPLVLVGSNYNAGGNSQVKVIKQVEEEVLKCLYSNAYYYVSRSLIEGFGLPLIEAGAFKVPSIVSDIPAHREVLEEHGLYMSVTSNKKAYCTLIQALVDENVRKYISERLSWYIPEKYSWQVVGEKLKKMLA